MKNNIGFSASLSLALGFCFFLVPVMTMVVFSFNDGRLISEWNGFSGRWYNALIHDDGFMNAAWNSAFVAIVSSTIGTGLGTAMGIALARVKGFRSRVMISSMIYGPILLPPVAIGLVLAVLSTMVGAKPGLAAVTIAHAVLSSCVVALLVRAQLMLVEPILEDVSIDLGCTFAGIWTQVILPILAPVILAGWIFSAALSLGDMVLAHYLSDRNAITLPVKIYSQIKLGPTPMVNAASTVLICVTVVLITAAYRLWAKSSKLHSPGSG